MADWIEKVREVAARSTELEGRMGDPQVARNPSELARLGKELADLRPIVEAGRRYEEVVRGIEEAQAMLSDSDADVQELAKSELTSLQEESGALDQKLRLLFVPKDPTDGRDAIVEIRAGTGGDEAALFAADLFRMYNRFAEAKGWKVEPYSLSETGGGGLKEAIVGVSGKQVFGRLKHERGVHRVQRVPTTESQGRIHTSTVTVAIMPEAEEVDIAIEPSDLRVDVFRSSGPGGQSVNTTDSAVRITHVPTGVVVTCQDEKSQHKNKAKAMKVLRSRLLEAEIERKAAERADARRAQVGSGERSEKIRTYNFPQNRVTDHRAGLTLHKLESILEGEIEELLDGVAAHMAAELDRASQQPGAAA